jgi:hypothetical protein
MHREIGNPLSRRHSSWQENMVARPSVFRAPPLGKETALQWLHTSRGSNWTPGEAVKNNFNAACGLGLLILRLKCHHELLLTRYGKGSPGATRVARRFPWRGRRRRRRWHSGSRQQPWPCDFKENIRVFVNFDLWILKIKNIDKL